MRLQPAAIYGQSVDFHGIAGEALSLRLSINDLATICEHHPHAVEPLLPLLDVLRARAKERGWALDVPRVMSELAAEVPELAALAIVIRPFAQQFGAHLTAPRSNLPPIGALFSVARAREARPIAIDLGAAIGPVTASSAKLRALAQRIAEGPQTPVSRPPPNAQPEAEPWAGVAELLFELHADSAAFVEKYGELGKLFADELSRAAKLTAPEPPNWDALAAIVSTLYHRHGENARGLIDALVRRDELIPRNIPELDLIEAGVASDTFSKVGIAGIQHLFPSLVPLIEAFIRHGANASDIWLLAKDYTNNPLVIAYLRTLGVHVMDATEDVDGTYHVEDARAKDVAAFAKAATPALAACERELILDDGAALIAHLNTSANHRRRAVELTTKGHNRLAELELEIPALSIARAPNKIDEGEVIGIDLANGLCRELRWQQGQVDRDAVLAVGLGTVGSSFLAELDRRGIEAIGFDLDEKKRLAASSAAPGAKIVSTLEEGASEARYAVLITGTGPTDAKIFIAHGVQVASGSSEAVELDENQFFELALLNAPLNGMRPLNFVRTGHETLSHRQIGLTRATFFAACAQVLELDEPGRKELKTTPALEAAAALWKSEGKSIARPAPAKILTPPKPSSNVQPTHSEWMRFFIEGSMCEESPLMVRPAPSAVNFAAQPYLYFHEGGWHLVDTRDGESRRLKLGAEWNDPHTQLLVLADSGAGSSALLRPTRDGSQLAVIDPSGRVRAPIVLGRPQGAATSPTRDFTWIFESPRAIELVSGGPKTRVRRFERVDHAPSKYAVLGDETLLQATAAPTVYLHRPDSVAQLNNHGLAELLAISAPSNRPEESSSVFLVGREPSGRIAVLCFDSADAVRRTVLPEGAQYRRVDAFAGEAPAVIYEKDGRLERRQF
jgi:hypothetical protein